MATFNSFATYFQTYGVLDFLLPFLLVFTIMFAILEKIEILGKDKKRFNVVVALAIGLLFVVPHVLGTYPLGYDPVQVLNETIPSIALVGVAAIMLLLLMGFFGTDFSKSAAPFIALAAIGFVAYIFGSSLQLWSGPSQVFAWWSQEVTELLIIILVFGVIVWFITKEPSDKNAGSELLKGVGKLFEKNK